MATKKKKTEKVEPPRLYLVYDQHESGGEICKGDEDSAWPSHEDAHIDVRFKALYRNPPTDRFFYDSFEVSEDIYKEPHLHMGVIRYADGGTFGRTCGYFHVVGFYKTSTEAAEAIQKALKAEGTYKPWEGYFASFEDDQIEIMAVLEQ